MSRKGDIFMAGLNLFFLLAIAFVFWKLTVAFQLPDPGEGIGTVQTATLQTYAVSDEALLYLDEAAKYAAYESIGIAMERGALTASACGSYAGYPLWAVAGKDCYPGAARQRAFNVAFRERLQDYLLLPGLAGTQFSTTVIEGNLLTITGVGQPLRVPILVVKDGPQSKAEDILLGEMRKTDVTFAADYAGADVVPSPVSTPRVQPPGYLIIDSTGTQTLQEALQRYQGDESVHYVIDEQGGITQLVREDEVAIHMSCTDAMPCTLERRASAGEVNQQSTSIALVHAVPTMPKVQDGKPVCEGTLTACSAPGCTQLCWTSYPAKQIDALKALAGDILARRTLQVKTAEQVRPGIGTPGPQINTLLPGIVATSAQAKIAAPQSTSSTATTAVPATSSTSAGPKVAWPVDSEVITSCYGPRWGREHKGLDFRAGVGDNVYSISDGVIERAYVSTTFGNTIVIRHSTTFFSLYAHLSKMSVKEGDRVVAGQKIGEAGNTGRSEAPHLHMEVYPQYPPQGATSNPLCLFDESFLQRAQFKEGGNCQQFGYTTPSRSDLAVAAACAGTASYAAGSFDKCSAATSFGSEASATLDILTKLPASQSTTLLDEIKTAADANGLDYRLLIAQISAESGGDPLSVSPVGAVGISQFMPATAREEFVGIAPIDRIRECGCAQSRSCKDADPSCSKYDPRFDPATSVKAQAKYLAKLRKPYAKYTDRDLFALAAYNAGIGNVNNAIEAAKAKGEADPRWVTVGPLLPKPSETIPYVDRIIERYTALGGSTGTLYNEMQCKGMMLREVGTYEFTPKFTVAIPNTLTRVTEAEELVQSIRNQCDGKDGIDNRACIQEKSGMTYKGVALTACDDANTALVESLAETIRDCKDNGQTGCACHWSPPQKLDAKQVTIDIYGNDEFFVMVDDAIITTTPAHLGALPSVPLGGRFRASDISADHHDIKILLTYSGGTLSQVKLSASAQDGDARNLVAEGVLQSKTVPILKSDSDIAWTTDERTIACGEHKTMHRLCLQVTDSIPAMSKSSWEKPIIRASVELNDVSAPPVVTDLKAVLAGVMQVTFAPSAAQDISYYNVYCTAKDQTGKEIKPEKYTYIKILEGKEQLSATFESCNGQPFNAQNTYEVTVEAFDISGNRGDRIAVKAVSSTTAGTVGTVVQAAQ